MWPIAVICGDDVLLADLRARVLATASFEAQACYGVDALSHRDDSGAHLFVLCSSMNLNAQRYAGEWLAMRYPGVPVITFQRTGVEPHAPAGHVLQVHHSPEDFIRLSRELTSNAS